MQRTRDTGARALRQRRSTEGHMGTGARVVVSDFDPPLSSGEEVDAWGWRKVEAASLAVVMLIFIAVAFGYAGVFDEGVRNIVRYSVVVQIVFVVLFSLRALTLLWRDRRRLKTDGKEIDMVIFHVVALGAVLYLNSRKLGVVDEPLLKTSLASDHAPQEIKQDVAPVDTQPTSVPPASTEAPLV